ncbi:TPA: hypothetical protein MYO83_001400 [Klebsiella michiganensis]|nr:hypothetical protein [Klebsiella michiganensis]HCB1845443.1 hypothetical protein [Klebsiella oxytoca]
MSIISREKSQRVAVSHCSSKCALIRHSKEQLDAVAAEEGVSLASWFKELARSALKSKGIEPQG